MNAPVSQVQRSYMLSDMSANTSTKTDKSADYSLEQLEAIWLEFQRHGQAHCPLEGGELEITLKEHPIETKDSDDSHQPTEVYVQSKAGKRAIYRPQDNTVNAWVE
jgi:hypothetical protein